MILISVFFCEDKQWKERRKHISSAIIMRRANCELIAYWCHDLNFIYIAGVYNRKVKDLPLYKIIES